MFFTIAAIAQIFWATMLTIGCIRAHARVGLPTSIIIVSYAWFIAFTLWWAT